MSSSFRLYLLDEQNFLSSSWTAPVQEPKRLREGKHVPAWKKFTRLAGADLRVRSGVTFVTDDACTSHFRRKALAPPAHRRHI